MQVLHFGEVSAYWCALDVASDQGNCKCTLHLPSNDESATGYPTNGHQMAFCASTTVLWMGWLAQGGGRPAAAHVLVYLKHG
jgi:hypothetical protein